MKTIRFRVLFFGMLAFFALGKGAEAATAITSCNTVITTAGDYELTGDLTCSSGDGSSLFPLRDSSMKGAIVIKVAASDGVVNLDCQNYAIDVGGSGVVYGLAVFKYDGF